MNPAVFSMPLTEAKQCFEKAYLENLLKLSGGNISEAARISGITPAAISLLLVHLKRGEREPAPAARSA